MIKRDQILCYGSFSGRQLSNQTSSSSSPEMQKSPSRPHKHSMRLLPSSRVSRLRGLFHAQEKHLRLFLFSSHFSHRFVSSASHIIPDELRVTNKDGKENIVKILFTLSF